MPFELIDCPDCGASGGGVEPATKCRRCDGKGHIYRETAGAVLLKAWCDRQLVSLGLDVVHQRRIYQIADVISDVQAESLFRVLQATARREWREGRST